MRDIDYLPMNRFSAHRSGTYNRPLSTRATSKPMSPVVSAIGPVHHTWAMHGITSPKHSIPLVMAAKPMGSLLELDQIA